MASRIRALRRTWPILDSNEPNGPDWEDHVVKRTLLTQGKRRPGKAARPGIRDETRGREALAGGSMIPAEMREVLLEEARWWANKPAKPDYIPYAHRMATRSLWRGRIGHPGHS